MPTAGVYSASKVALISLARNLSAELLPRRIRVNAISPGPVVTPFHTTRKLGITEEQLGQMGAGILSQIPVGLKVLGKVQPDKAALQSVVNVAMGSLRVR